MSKKIVLATQNENKVIEIINLIASTDIEVIRVNGKFAPEENGKTFEENAYIKALAAAKIMSLPALADDSGLMVQALNGNPGIYSARYADTNEARINRVLLELKNSGSENRKAQFICAMALILPDGKILYSCLGKCNGLIIDTPTGNHGFGYDPIFYIPELDKTMAELSLEEKNKISHRANALNCMINWIKQNL